MDCTNFLENRYDYLVIEKTLENIDKDSNIVKKLNQGVKEVMKDLEVRRCKDYSMMKCFLKQKIERILLTSYFVYDNSSIKIKILYIL